MPERLCSIFDSICSICEANEPQIDTDKAPGKETTFSRLILSPFPSYLISRLAPVHLRFLDLLARLYLFVEPLGCFGQRGNSMLFSIPHPYHADDEEDEGYNRKY